jgi:hypothetical protein
MKNVSPRDHCPMKQRDEYDNVNDDIIGTITTKLTLSSCCHVDKNMSTWLVRSPFVGVVVVVVVVVLFVPTIKKYSNSANNNDDWLGYVYLLPNINIVGKSRSVTTGVRLTTQTKSFYLLVHTLLHGQDFRQFQIQLLS